MKEQLSKILGHSSSGEDKIHDIDMVNINTNPFQPRKDFDDDKIDELAQSIKTYGLIQPIILRKSGENYEIIAGERRFRASKLLGNSKIKAIVKEEVKESAMAAIALIENIQRENLNFLEEAEGLHRLLNDFKLTQEVLAQRLGKSQSTIANKLRLLKLNDNVKEKLKNSQLTERHARALLKVPCENQPEMVDRIIDEGMTVRQTEELITLLSSTGEDVKEDGKKESKKRKMVFKDFRIFLNTIKQAVDTIKGSGIDAQMDESDLGDCIEVKIRLPKNK
ncbi:nucleoid occlusion protein [Proteinivorax hydrogeniformans]|uniref:Nucleoid occlusion protein n=1 Tax=Proteinivorax hydrogeniformans TaxID=1826727 RepID=A0AAU8HTX5_9FIRM